VTPVAHAGITPEVLARLENVEMLMPFAALTLETLRYREDVPSTVTTRDEKFKQRLAKAYSGGTSKQYHDTNGSRGQP
jgi:hypothetical protein